MSELKEAFLPKRCGHILDIAPCHDGLRSAWFLLAEDGALWRYDAASGNAELVSKTKISSERSSQEFNGKTTTPHLHVSENARFAAIVNDYGRYGQILDLHSGNATLALDGGSDDPETVPFSFAFVSRNTQTLAIHRTAWNRLDISDAATGELITHREFTNSTSSPQPHPHHLDYFHGALQLSPDGSRVLDDGWVWHPVGIPVAWSVDRWLSENPFESEDGPTRKEVCAREYYWDVGMAWLDNSTVAIGGLGDSDTDMVDGVRIFDVTSSGPASPKWRSDWEWAREVRAFPRPTGRFFSNRGFLYSAGQDGLSQWDPSTGVRARFIESFRPTHHHKWAEELVEVAGSTLLRWRTSRE